jgi:RimJ/RimL family protein N-acetyltransferase
LTIDDASSYEKHFVDYRVIRTMSAAVPWPYPNDGVQDYLRNFVVPIQGKDRWIWGIAEKDTPNEVIGSVDLWREGKPESRGFWLGYHYWGRGYMTEAVEPVMNYAFDRLGFEKLIFTNGLTRS